MTAVQSHLRPLETMLPRRAPRPDDPIRVLIADDDRLMREQLLALLTLQPDFRVIGETRDADEAIRLATELEPDVMLLDFSTPKTSRLDVMRALNGGHTRIRTILLTAAVERLDLIKLLQHGARGLVLKGSPTELLFKCIRKVHRGEVWIGRETVAEVVEELASHADGWAVAEPCDFRLTPREREILGRLVTGETNSEIAQRLAVGRDTVKHHLTSIFNKTGASNRLELAVFALHRRLVKTY